MGYNRALTPRLSPLSTLPERSAGGQRRGRGRRRSPWTQRARPQGAWKTAKNAVSHSAHSHLSSPYIKIHGKTGARADQVDECQEFVSFRRPLTPEAAAGTDPDGRPATDNLTFTERKTVVAATRNAAIPDETVGRIIRGLLGAPTIGKLTLAEINGAVERYNVDVPAAASWPDVMIAVLKHLRDRAPAKDSSENSAADGGEDGSAPPPRGGEPSSGDAQPLDSVEAAHANIAAASMLTLEKKDRTAAERIKNNYYETWRERSAAIDAAIAEADRRSTRTPRPAGGSRQRRAEDSSRGGNGERPEPLSLSEQVAFQLRNIPNDEIAILKKMAKGDEKKLLELAEKYHSSGK